MASNNRLSLRLTDTEVEYMELIRKAISDELKGTVMANMEITDTQVIKTALEYYSKNIGGNDRNNM